MLSWNPATFSRNRRSRRRPSSWRSSSASCSHSCPPLPPPAPLRQAPAYGVQLKGGNFPLRQEREVGRFLRELRPAIQFETRLAQELGGKTHVFGAVNAPEP